MRPDIFLQKYLNRQGRASAGCFRGNTVLPPVNNVMAFEKKKCL